MRNEPATNSPSFGEVIRQRRVELGLTQEELAERVGENVRQSDISRLERDYVMLPRRDRLEALAAALDVSSGYLLMHSGWITQDELSLLERAAEQDSTPRTESRSDPLESGAETADMTTWGHDRSAEWSPSPNAMSSLNEAISRAHQIAAQTDEILRRSSAAMTQVRARTLRNTEEPPE